MLQKNSPTSSLPHAMRGLETAPSQMKRTRFYVEDILRPDFGTTTVDNGCTQVRSTKDLPTPLINEGEGPPPRDPEKGGKERQEGERGKLWPAWVYCTRYSDRPSSGPRTRKVRKKEGAREEKRPRTAFSPEQLERLREEFTETQYLSEDRRRLLASQLNLNEAQIKIWFQNKRAKMKKTSPIVNPLAVKLRQEGLYNHSAGNPGDS